MPHPEEQSAPARDRERVDLAATDLVERAWALSDVALPDPSRAHGDTRPRAERRGELRRQGMRRASQKRFARNEQSIGIGRARLLDASVYVSVAQRERDARRDGGAHGRLDTIRDRRPNVEVVGLAGRRRSAEFDKIAETLIEVGHRDRSTFNTHFPAQRAFGLQVGISLDKSVREVLEKRGFLEPRSACDTHTKLVKPVYEAAPIRRVRPELPIVVEPATQGHGCGAGTEHGLAEVAGVVALHVDRIRERACCRRTVFALAALALVFVFDPATHGRSIAYVPVEQRAR